MSPTATPTKRRVLGSLDLNVQMSPRSPRLAGSPVKKGSREASLSLSRRASPSPRKAVSKRASPSKRPLEEAVASQQAVKKLCSDIGAVEVVSLPEVGAAAAAAAAIAASAKQPTTRNTDEDEPSASQPTTGDRRSLSPDASSLFDVSGMNTSQDTTITEPDLDAPIAAAAAAPHAPVAPHTLYFPNNIVSSIPPTTRRISTREELRQKIEILKLRLSLANYKVQTGQVDVPLDRLQIRPVPGMARRRTPLPSMSAHTVERSTPAQQWYRLANERKTTATSLPARVGMCINRGEHGHDMADNAGASPPAPDKNYAPRLSSASLSIVSTPRSSRREVEEEERLTSSALRGGAAKGLLSLALGPVGQ